MEFVFFFIQSCMCQHYIQKHFNFISVPKLTHTHTHTHNLKDEAGDVLSFSYCLHNQRKDRNQQQINPNKEY